jgi:hypothetical protein
MLSRNTTIKMTASISASCAMSITAVASQSNADASMSEIRARGLHESPGGGMAGVGYSENFEDGYTLGLQCGGTPPSGGWTRLNCPLEIVCCPDPLFELHALAIHSGSVPAGSMTMTWSTPSFGLQTGAIHADLIITDAASLFQILTVNSAVGFFNTRINFEADGSIRALQVRATPCSTGVFAATSATWTPGEKMRIGVDVEEGGVLRVYKDAVQIFEGYDIAQHCDPSNPAVGMNQLRVYNSNASVTTTLIIDNISNEPVVNLCAVSLGSCPADVSPTGLPGLVDIDDLLTVITNWGHGGQPVGPRPEGDCAPGSSGDCVVNIDDLLAVINAWGPCQ